MGLTTTGATLGATLKIDYIHDCKKIELQKWQRELLLETSLLGYQTLVQLQLTSFLLLENMKTLQEGLPLLFLLSQQNSLIYRVSAQRRS